MSDQKLRELGTRLEDTTPMPAFDDLERRAHRRIAVRRTGILAAVVAATVVAGIGVAQVTDGKGQTSPSPVDRSEQEIEQSDDVSCLTPGPNCFADIHGWIAYSEPGRSGIWAVNPAASLGPAEFIQVTDRRGDEPLEWSSDGTKLLIRRGSDLVVLNVDGTETRLADGESLIDGSFSPDGSQVIYSGYGENGIHAVDADGGTPQLLMEAFEGRSQLYNGVFSPDGTTIAYFDGAGDHSHSLRVMNSDGTDIRVLHDESRASHVRDLAWSPDGQRLMFVGDAGLAGVWIIGVDGSGLTHIAGGGTPAWSPDGTRISFTRGGNLVIADPDGTNATTVANGRSGPWNPLPLERP